MRTITFYSYKGGVGRTLVVANVARYLARFGQKVFVVDFDLEAPGLHYKFGLAGQGTDAIQVGLMDYIYEFVAKGEISELIEPYVRRIETSSTTGSIHLLPAGPAPSADYWRKLARVNWHELFYSEQAPGIPFFLDLKEKIAAEFQPDFLLIDSRTGITEVGGVATSLLADQVVCLLIYNRENLEGAREVLRSVRRARRLPGQRLVEILPVLTRIPEQDEQEEARIAGEVREFLNEEAEELSNTLHAPEVLVLHSDPELQMNESLRIGGTKSIEQSTLLRDYLHLFARLVSKSIIESYMEPLIEQAVKREAEDPEGAQKDIDALVSYSYHPEICRELLYSYRSRMKSGMGEASGWRHGSIFGNGIDEISGKYTATPFLSQELLNRIEDSFGLPVPKKREVHRGIDLQNLEASGWGIVFSEADPNSGRIREALKPLLELRREASRDYYREIDYLPGESALEFRRRHRVGPGATDPRLLPYYLLIVGSPEQIPQHLLYGLRSQHGIGRICFDTADEYRSYAETVVQAETGKTLRDRKATLFAPQNPFDPATELICRELVRPLEKALKNTIPGWTVQSFLEANATKDRLTTLLKDGPALLFTASHTVTLPRGHDRQVLDQGAIVCQDWPGPLWREGSLKPEFYFNGQDVPIGTSPGIVTMHFGSYTAGTPARGDSVDESAPPRSFVSSLAQRLLGHPNGGALAVIGQFGRTWLGLFSSDEQVRIFESSLLLLMEGFSVGAAMEFLSQRYAELSSILSDLRERSGDMNYDELASILSAFREAQTYTVLGDPAVRLAVAPEPASRKRVTRG